MRRCFVPLSLLSLLPGSLAYCPTYGNVFPKPKDLASSTTVKTALKSLNDAIALALSSGNSTFGAVDPNSAHAIQLFSLEDSDSPLFEYYHDGTTLSNSTGAKTVDGDSVFRIGSVSKLVSVYLLLIEVGDKYWDVAVTDVVPELQGRANWTQNEVDFVKWEDITLGALAGQVAGVARDVIVFEGLHPLDGPIWVEQFGLPPLSPSELPACVISVDPAVGNNCDRKQFFEALDVRQPVFKPNTQPIYSNTGFVILGYALESITGKAYTDLLQTLVDQLNLTRTSQKAPEESRGLIPFNVTTSDWGRDLGEAAPAGQLYASVNDLSKMGRSILGSTILDANITRAWLKPTSVTSDLLGNVGRPWEIYRADTVPSRGVIDIYTKGGSIGLYQTSFAVIPDYDIGFSIAAVGGGDYSWINTLIVNILFPALESAAREQADAAYSGTYIAKSGLNSTITLRTDANKPGLGIDQWISNGTDFLQALPQFLGGLPGAAELIRLLPTNFERQIDSGSTEVAWRAVFDVSGATGLSGPFSACPSWFTVDAIGYGNYSVDQFVFEVGADGKATKAIPKAFKVELVREERDAREL